MTTAFFIACLAGVALFYLGCKLGYELGVKDTEDRWRDAVAKTGSNLASDFLGRAEAE